MPACWACSPAAPATGVGRSLTSRYFGGSTRNTHRGKISAALGDSRALFVISTSRRQADNKRSRTGTGHRTTGERDDLVDHGVVVAMINSSRRLSRSNAASHLPAGVHLRGIEGRSISCCARGSRKHCAGVTSCQPTSGDLGLPRGSPMPPAQAPGVRGCTWLSRRGAMRRIVARSAAPARPGSRCGVLGTAVRDGDELLRPPRYATAASKWAAPAVGDDPAPLVSWLPDMLGTAAFKSRLSLPLLPLGARRGGLADRPLPRSRGGGKSA